MCNGFEQVVLGKCCDLRTACMTIPDELAARMPLSYVHFAHFLVDSLLLLLFTRYRTMSYGSAMNAVKQSGKPADLAAFEGKGTLDVLCCNVALMLQRSEDYVRASSYSHV